MRAKEFLCQVEEKQERIVEQEEYIERLRSTLDVAGIRYDIDKIQTTPDPDKLANTFSKIIELEEELKEMKNNFVLFKVNVIDMIHQMKDSRHRQLLNIVYIDYKSLKQCAVEMNFSYDHIREMHGKALFAFEEMFPQ